MFIYSQLKPWVPSVIYLYSASCFPYLLRDTQQNFMIQRNHSTVSGSESSVNRFKLLPNTTIIYRITNFVSSDLPGDYLISAKLVKVSTVVREKVIFDPIIGVVDLRFMSFKYIERRLGVHLSR